MTFGKNTLVIGDVGVGKTTYLQKNLEGVDGVYWLALGTPVPTDVAGTSVWNYKQWLDVAKLPELKAAKVLVLDGLSNLQGLLLAGVLMTGKNAGGNPEQKDYGSAAYQLYQGFLLVGALGKPMHASLLTREKTVGKGEAAKIETELFLAPQVQGFILPSFPAAAYITMKVLAGEAKYAVQENPVLAKQLISAKVK